MCLVVLLTFLAIVGFAAAIIAWVYSALGGVAAAVVGFLALAVLGGILEGRKK